MDDELLIDHHVIRIRNGEIEKREMKNKETKWNVKVLIDHHASRIKKCEIEMQNKNEELQREGIDRSPCKQNQNYGDREGCSVKKCLLNRIEFNVRRNMSCPSARIVNCINPMIFKS